jgi:hypothetical protein
MLSLLSIKCHQSTFNISLPLNVSYRPTTTMGIWYSTAHSLCTQQSSWSNVCFVYIILLLIKKNKYITRYLPILLTNILDNLYDKSNRILFFFVLVWKAPEANTWSCDSINWVQIVIACFLPTYSSLFRLLRWLKTKF